MLGNLTRKEEISFFFLKPKRSLKRDADDVKVGQLLAENLNKSFEMVFLCHSHRQAGDLIRQLLNRL